MITLITLFCCYIRYKIPSIYDNLYLKREISLVFPFLIILDGISTAWACILATFGTVDIDSSTEQCIRMFGIDVIIRCLQCCVLYFSTRWVIWKLQPLMDQIDRQNTRFSTLDYYENEISNVMERVSTNRSRTPGPPPPPPAGIDRSDRDERDLRAKSLTARVSVIGNLLFRRQPTSNDKTVTFVDGDDDENSTRQSLRPRSKTPQPKTHREIEDAKANEEEKQHHSLNANVNVNENENGSNDTTNSAGTHKKVTNGIFSRFTGLKNEIGRDNGNGNGNINTNVLSNTGSVLSSSAPATDYNSGVLTLTGTGDTSPDSVYYSDMPPLQKSISTSRHGTTTTHIKDKSNYSNVSLNSFTIADLLGKNNHQATASTSNISISNSKNNIKNNNNHSNHNNNNNSGVLNVSLNTSLGSNHSSGSINARPSSGKHRSRKSKSKLKSIFNGEIKLGNVLSHAESFELLMQHLSKEFSMEILLSIIEFTQYINLLVSQEIVEANNNNSKNIKSELLNVELPNNIPKSSIVNKIENATINVNSENQKQTMYDQCFESALLLYQKYIKTSSAYEVKFFFIIVN